MASGRPGIAMTAVRRRACAEPGEITGSDEVCPPTDVMAITSLPARRSREGTCGHGDKGAWGDGSGSGADAAMS